MAETALLTCPMCDFVAFPSDTYMMQLHFEQEHIEDSPFKIKHDPEPLPSALSTLALNSTGDRGDVPSDPEDSNTVLCPEADCGEAVLLTTLNEHLDLHAAERLTLDDEAAVSQYHHHHQSGKMQNLAAEDSTLPSFLEQNFNTQLPEGLRTDGHHPSGEQRKLKRRTRGNSTASEKSTLGRTIASFNPFTKQNKSVKPPKSNLRLGRSELGPHAWEDRMPTWLHKQLEEGPKVTVVNRIGRDGRLIKQEQVQNETPGIIPILAQLSALDRSVKEAYYCHPSTLHIGKTPKEGGFCGYRNIQMLISYIQGAHAQGFEEFPGRTPGILKLQDLIERAWDRGINTIGRQQTGGIRDTRKYIGTPEAQALFLGAQIDCAVEMFTDSTDGLIEAHEQLFTAIERYFRQGATPDGSNVYKTLLPPIYLQQPGHSLTIIGFERHKDSSCNLMIFDSMFHASPRMHQLIGRKNIRTSRPEVMHAYRRTVRQLRRHAAFEILMLTAHPPLFPAWDVLRQFPDCRYVYVFFRSRTLGYDVYPEDHFLRSFPWQQYGGLWIVEDARFARADKMNPLTAAALRRLTGEGAFYSSSRYGSGNCGNSLMSSSLLSSASSSRHVSMMSTLDGHCTQGPDSLNYILEMTGMHMANSKSSPNKPRRYQGYCSPESPTTLAKEIYSTPPSNSGDGSGNRRVFSPMSVDGSDMCGPSRRCTSHSYEVYQNALGSSQGSWPGDIRTNTSAIALSPTSSTSVAELMNVHPHAKTLQWKDRQSSGSLSLPPTSPTSPPRITSPRTAMLKDMYNKQAFQTLSSHEPSQLSPLFHRFNGWISPLNGYTTLPSVSSVSNGWSSSSTDSNCPLTAAVYGGLPAPISFDDQQTPRSLKAPQPLSSPARPNNPTPDSKPPPFSPNETLFSSSPPSDPRFRTSTPPPSIFIADGLETAIHSPLSSSGTLLSYTSNRGVDSGLLAVKPLSEVQVAEYRFWRPCGRGRCTFGCGESREGERRAAGRLFRGVSAVEEDLEHGEGDGGDFEAEEGGEEGYGREERFGRFEYEGRE